MINMLKADCYKLLRSTGTYIALLLLLLFIGISVYSVSPSYIVFSSTSAEIMDSDVSAQRQSAILHAYDEDTQSSGFVKIREKILCINGYELDRDILSGNINLYYLFIFFVATVLTVDFTDGCIKNSLSSAISRKKYYLSKLCFISLCCILILFANTYITHFATIILDSEKIAASLEEVTKITLLQMPPILELASILTGIGFMTKRTALFNVITIPLLIVVDLMFRIMVVLFDMNTDFFYYGFQSMFANLAYNPTTDYIMKSYLICAVVIVAINLLGYLSFKKAEIK